MKHLAAPALVWSILACVLAGCLTHSVQEGTRPGTRVVTPETQARLNQAGILTPGLERRVAVEKTGADRTSTNTLEVWATLRNRTQYEQKILVRTQYYNNDRTAVEGPDQWQSIFLPPNAIDTYRTYSRGTDAAFYYIEIMEFSPPAK